MSRDAASLSGYWQRQIFSLACRLNFGWWLDRFLALFLGISLLCMCALLLARRQGWEEFLVWKSFAWALLPLGLGAFFWARRHFENRSSARVRLEYALHLHNRLTAAASGVGDWPQPRTEMPEVLRWRWRPILTLLLPAVFLLLAGAFVPVPKDEEGASQGMFKPPALEQLEALVQALEQNQVLEEKTLEELKQQVEQLADRPSEEWYSQSSLEAADHLRDTLKNQLKALQQDLQKAEGALAKMQPDQPALSESQMAQLSEKLAEALQDARAGQLPLNAKLLENMPEIDPAKLKALNPEQAKALMERIKQAQGAMKDFQEGDGDPIMALAMMEVQLGQPQGGGINRGPGTVPLTLNPDPSELGSDKVEGVSNEDLSRAGLGESVGISKGEHDTENLKYEGPVAGGAAAQGAGGEAVWTNRLTPAEQAQVKAFFK